VVELGEDRTDGAGDLLRSFEAWDDGDLEKALDGLQGAVAADEDSERRNLLRSVMVAIFTELGADHPLAREHRRRLAAALT
jgi:thioredoxin-like negative regulator of GroEL